MLTNIVPLCYIILQHQNRYLLVQRNSEFIPEPNSRWNFLKGEINLGESPSQSATRIAKTTIGIEIELMSMAKVIYHSSRITIPDKPPVTHLAFCFYAKLKDEQNLPKLKLDKDILAKQWVAKEELGAIQFDGPQGAYVARQVVSRETYPLSLLKE